MELNVSSIHPKHLERRRIEQRLETLINADGHVGKDRAGGPEAIRKSLEFLDPAARSTCKMKKPAYFPV